MILYHFTSMLHRIFIDREGMNRGECPVNDKLILNHPNLTIDPSPHNQGWSVVGRGGNVVNKQAVRYTVEIPDGDENLLTWTDLTRLHGMSKATYWRYNAAGGWCAKNWWIYRGTVPPDWFKAVEVLSEGITEIEQHILTVAQDCGTYDEVLERLGAVKKDNGYVGLDLITVDILAD